MSIKTRREGDLIAIDLAYDARASRDEREYLDSQRSFLNENPAACLPEKARERIAEIAQAVRDRGPGQSAGSLLDAMPRPLKPPSAPRIQVAS